ncbi:MAG: FtsX-like permease family protein, partial [bacterium]
MEAPTQSGSWLERQRSIIDYSLQSLFRRRTKNGLILIMYVLLIFVVSSVFFITGSLTVELFSTVDELPDITVQKLIGGRQTSIQESYFPAIREIPGVGDVQPRIWGYFYLQELQANFTVYGMDLHQLEAGDYQRIIDWKPLPQNTQEHPDFRMVIGVGVYRLLKEIQMQDSFLFFQPNWDTAIPFDIIGTFKSETQLQSNDLMVMQTEGARRVLELKPGDYTDLVVHVPNPEETEMIALKIRRYYPELRTVTRSQIESTYTSAYNWKGGFVLSSMLVVIFAFLVLIWDKASGLSPAEKKEIGILKAIGWDTEMILSVKFWESFIISFCAAICGVILSYFYIYWLHAPGFKEIFIGWSTIYPDFKLIPDIDIKFLLLIVTVTVIPYSAIAVFPSW